MKDKETEYLKTEKNKKNTLRVELMFSPVLVILPLLVSFVMVWDWYFRGYVAGSPIYDGQLFVALIILIGNILFDIPFIKSLKTYKRS